MSKLGRRRRSREERVASRQSREQRAIAEREDWERARARFWARLTVEPPAVS